MDKSKVMMIIIIVLLAILLGTIGFVSVYAINLLNANVEGNGVSTAATERDKIKQEDMEMVKYNNAVKGIIPETTHAVTFKVSVGIDNSDKKNKKDVEELVALLESRDVVISSIASEVLLSHTVDEYVYDTEIKQILSNEILERVQSEFGSNLIVEVYLSDWVSG